MLIKKEKRIRNDTEKSSALKSALNYTDSFTIINKCVLKDANKQKKETLFVQ